MLNITSFPRFLKPSRPCLNYIPLQTPLCGIYLLELRCEITNANLSNFEIQAEYQCVVYRFCRRHGSKSLVSDLNRKPNARRLYENSEMSGKVFLRTLLAGYIGHVLHRSHFIDCSQNACFSPEAADDGAVAMLSCDDGNIVKLWVLRELENGDIPNVIIQDAEVQFGTQRKRCKPVFSINLPNLYLVGVQLGTPT